MLMYSVSQFTVPGSNNCQYSVDGNLSCGRAHLYTYSSRPD